MPQNEIIATDLSIRGSELRSRSRFVLTGSWVAGFRAGWRVGHSLLWAFGDLGFWAWEERGKWLFYEGKVAR